MDTNNNKEDNVMKQSIPQYSNDMYVAFPAKAPRRLRIDREFQVYPDGSVKVSQWLASQVNQFVPEARSMTGTSFALRAVAWFKETMVRRIKHKHMTRIKGRNRGLVDAVSRKGKPVKRMQDHVQGGYYHASPKAPLGLVSVDEELEIALANAGYRLRVS